MKNAFIHAKKFLWDGTYPKDQPAYICVAIQVARNEDLITPEEEQAAASLIQERIYPEETVQNWLIRKGIPIQQLKSELVQKHRHEWLDKLIQEFSEE